MGLLAGFLAATYCYIGTGVAFAAIGVPSGGAGIRGMTRTEEGMCWVGGGVEMPTCGGSGGAAVKVRRREA